mmetsp:Transcript_444/g.1088  ORF Transcript_444/g.1088 Transcript_444/m.1088 type:complete len:87 (-) Transcript_444:286-546(-)
MIAKIEGYKKIEAARGRNGPALAVGAASGAGAMAARAQGHIEPVEPLVHDGASGDVGGEQAPAQDFTLVSKAKRMWNEIVSVDIIL